MIFFHALITLMILSSCFSIPHALGLQPCGAHHPSNILDKQNYDDKSFFEQNNYLHITIHNIIHKSKFIEVVKDNFAIREK